MPIQTTKKNILFPDGAMVSIKGADDSSYYDVGAINSAVAATLNYTTNVVTTANAGDSESQIREMTIAGGFTLINLETEGVEKLGAGIFERVVTAGSNITTSPDQVVAAGWDDNTLYNLLPRVSSSDDTIVRAAGVIDLTSVTLDAGGTPEVLTENTDYVQVKDSNSPSGWSIQFISDGMSTVNPKEKDITIDYDSLDSTASTTIYAGSSTKILNAYAMKITHTDDNGKIRQLELYSVNPDSGGFQFNFKGANEDGLEEMPLTFTARLDSSRTNNRQLMAWTLDEGAA